MTLPIRTTLDDIQKISEFLSTKTLGCTVSDAKAILDKKYLDGRKLAALKLWGFITEEGEKLKATAIGRKYAQGDDNEKSLILLEVIKKFPAYYSIIERVSHRNETTLTTVDVGVHWTEHFKAESSSNEKILGDQAVCFFQIVQGAQLGTLKAGRKGNKTRFEFNSDAVNAYILNENVIENENKDKSTVDENDIVSSNESNEDVSILSGSLSRKMSTEKNDLTINLNIQLNVPETTDDKIYDKFFEAMKRHLLS